jgi:hypothetical protein
MKYKYVPARENEHLQERARFRPLEKQQPSFPHLLNKEFKVPVYPQEIKKIRLISEQ